MQPLPLRLREDAQRSGCTDSGFLYLVSLRAARVLARVMSASDPTGAAALLKTIDAAESAAVASIDKNLWVEASSASRGHFRAGTGWASKGKIPDALMSDSLHANMWSMILGFGPSTNQSRLVSHFLEEHSRNCAMPGSVGCVGIAQSPHIGRHGSEDVSPSFSMDLTANLFFSRAWNATAFLRGDGPTTPAEIVTRGVLDGLQADFFNWRDMYFGPANWRPDGYVPEYDCHDPGCRLKQPTTELRGDVLAGAPFENQGYSRQLSAWYIPLALSGQQWDASSNVLSFSPDVPADGPCAASEPSRWVLPFFVSGAAGHLELPRCVASGGEVAAVRLRLLAGRLDGATVRVARGAELVERAGLTLAVGEAATLSGGGTT